MDQDESGAQDPQFVSDFFGTPSQERCFEVISGPVVTFTDSTTDRISLLAVPLAALAGRAGNTNALDLFFSDTPDEQVVRYTLNLQLIRKFGEQFQYEFADSSEAALGIIKNVIEAGDKLVMVISDQTMPFPSRAAWHGN